jgi:hypothetical protein
MARPKFARPPRSKHLRAAYRSGLEKALAVALAAAGVPIQFETLRVPFEQPAKNRRYTPDFLLPNGIIIESKGIFAADDRNKHLWVKAQHPALDIRFVFSNAKAKLYKGSPTTYADWAHKNGFLYAHKAIPPEWVAEPVCPVRKSAADKMRC